MSHMSTARIRASTPFCIAILAAALLTAASAATNVLAASSKHTELGPKLIAGSVALAVALLATVALAAALSAFRQRQIIAGLAALLAFALAAAFSTSAALGTLGGPRLQATISAADTDTRRADLAAERKRTLGELETLAPARPSAEINPQIAAIMATPGVGVPACSAVDGPITRKVCPALASLQEEAARANRRSALEGTAARIDRDLAKLGGPTIVNADSAAIVAVGASLGVPLRADAVSTALLLLGVVLLEVGGGLAMAVAQSLRVHVDKPKVQTIAEPAQPDAVNHQESSANVVPAIVAPVVDEPKIAPATAKENVHHLLQPKASVPVTSKTARRPRARARRASPGVAREKATAILAGFQSAPSVRELARIAGVSKSAAHEALQLASARTAH